MSEFSKKHVGFPSTLWTDIARWENASSGERYYSLDRFYYRYKAPLLKFIQYQGYFLPESEDILHGFIANHIEGRIFIHADPSKGRFRNLLLTSLKNYLTSLKRSENAEMRRPVGGISSLDDEIIEGLPIKDVLSDGCSPDEIYEKTWLLTVLKNVLGRLKAECKEKNQVSNYLIFKKRVLDPILYGYEKPSIQIISKQLGIRASEASNYLVTVKRAYQRHLREEIKEYVSSEKEVTDEINDLRYFLQNVNQ